MPVAFEIVSPEKLLLSRNVDMAVIPAYEGELGVLPGHAPMIVQLRGGAVRLYEGQSVVGQYFVAGGFAEVTAERCTVLATEAMPVAELSPAAAEARLAEATAAYEGVDKLSPDAVDHALDRLQIARAMRELAGAKP